MRRRSAALHELSACVEHVIPLTEGEPRTHQACPNLRARNSISGDRDAARLVAEGHADNSERAASELSTFVPLDP